MPVKTLKFFEVGTYPYPYATTGSGTALACCLHNNDPALAFVTQTPLEDEIVFLHLHLSVSVEDDRYPTPPNFNVISGMAYDRATNDLIVVQSTTGRDLIGRINSDTGIVTSTLIVPDVPGYGVAWKANHYIKTSGGNLQVLDTSGIEVSNISLAPGTMLRDICSMQKKIMGSDIASNKIIFYDANGNVDAECPTPPGTPGGITGVAFNNITDPIYTSQLPTENGAPGPVGTPYHPDTPWFPAPWKDRHQVYLANETDQKIHFGYFYL